MTVHKKHLPAALAATIALAAAAIDLPAMADTLPPPGAIQLAQITEPPPRELQPRYEPVPPPEKSWYNSSYIFGMTRSVANSAMAPGAKVPLFVLTVPLDLVFLPFEAIGGCFG